MDHYLSGCCLFVVFAVLSGIVRRAGDGVVCERRTALDVKMAAGVIAQWCQFEPVFIPVIL